MTLLCFALIVLCLLVGYLLGKNASQADYSGQLEAIHAAIEELTKNLCGDKGLESEIETMNEAGATLSDEELAYEGGSLDRIEREIRALSQEIERSLRQKQDPR